jgi:GGDEF domain-containing protein
MLLFCFILSLFGLPNNLKAILSLTGVILIVFSTPLITGQTSPFEGKTLIMYAVLVLIFLCFLIWSFTVLLGRNFIGATTLSLYLDSLIFRYRDIYHFVIDRKKQKVRFSKRFYNTFELSATDTKTLDYSEFIDFLRYSLVNVDPSVDIEQLLLSGKNRNYVVITPKTNQSKYVSLFCHKTWSGRYSGEVYDISNTIEAEDMLYHLTRKDPVTGFKPYHILKDELTDIASLHSGFMLQVHIMITFTQMIDSMYGYEMEKDYFRCIAQMLRSEFPDAYFYSVNASEMKIIKFDLEKTESALAYVDRIREFFYRPFEITGRRVFSIATMGVMISDTMRCNTIEQANALINKAIFAKEMAFQKKPGSTYIFKEQDYKDHIEQNKRSEQLPNLLRGVFFFTVFQPSSRFPTRRCLPLRRCRAPRTTSIPH